jgi:hypothetical protein
MRHVERSVLMMPRQLVSDLRLRKLFPRPTFFFESQSVFQQWMPGVRPLRVPAVVIDSRLSVTYTAHQ